MNVEPEQGDQCRAVGHIAHVVVFGAVTGAVIPGGDAATVQPRCWQTIEIAPMLLPCRIMETFWSAMFCLAPSGKLVGLPMENLDGGP